MPRETEQEESILTDLHIDPIIQHFLFDYDIREAHDESWRPRKRRWLFHLVKSFARLRGWHQPFFNHIDMPRMLKGGYAFGAFGIHHWPVQSEKGWQNILRQLAYFHRVVEHNQRLIVARTPADISRARQENKVAGFPAVEGAHCLGAGGKGSTAKRLARLDELFKKYSVRTLTLAHFSKTDVATPALGLGSNAHDSLADFGKAVIQKMNDIGMIVDVAHVNNQGVLDACRVSSTPVIVSHTGVNGIHEHARNIGDEAIHAVAETGGVIGIMFATNVLSGADTNPSSKIILEHIDYIVQTAGEDHAAIGSDFDGWIPRIPQDMNDATDVRILVRGMQNIGYTETRIRKILGENFLRVWAEILGSA